MDEKKSSKLWLNIIIVLIILVCLIVWVISQNDITDVINSIKNANIGYLLMGIGIIAIYWICNALTQTIIVKKNENIKIKDAMHIANAAQFYNCITPYQVGGNAFMVLYYHRLGIKPEKSIGYVVMSFIIHQLALNILSILAVILYFNYIKNEIDGLWVMVIIGFVINFSILAFLFMVASFAWFRKFVIFLLSKILSLKPFRNKKDEILESSNQKIMEFQTGFKELVNHKMMLMITLMIKIIGLIAYFMTPFFVFYALGVHVGIEKIWFIIWMSAFAFVIMSYMPTPGAAGGAEWAFNQVFISLPGVSKVLAATATLLWRFVTYYLSMLCGLLSVFLFERRKEE